LSLPQALVKNGHIDEWRERIIIPEIRIEPEGNLEEEDNFGPEIVVNVTRRA
jgi:hypothetical protein